MGIETATHLWFEAGDMSGGSRNQVEFSDEIVRFFDQNSRNAGRVFIAFNNRIKRHCPLTDRGQVYGQWTNIWRLGLITEDKGGVSYPGRVIHLEKIQLKTTYVYKIEVVDINSPEHKGLIAKSAYTGITAGAQGRNYGYW